MCILSLVSSAIVIVLLVSALFVLLCIYFFRSSGIHAFIQSFIPFHSLMIFSFRHSPICASSPSFVRCLFSFVCSVPLFARLDVSVCLYVLLADRVVVTCVSVLVSYLLACWLGCVWVCHSFSCFCICLVVVCLVSWLFFAVFAFGCSLVRLIFLFICSVVNWLVA